MSSASNARSEPLDFGSVDTGSFREAVVEQARIVWRDRVRTEYQSTQIAARCLGEALAAGEPLEVQRQLLEFVEEELRHVEICGAMCRALGVDPPAPGNIAAPLAALDPVPVSERLLASVISLFLVSETFSLGYLRDLRARPSHPVVTAVFDAIFADEEEHESFAPEFVARLLTRETDARRREWRTFTARIVAGHVDRARTHLAAVAPERRSLELWPDSELCALGLHSPERLALVALRTHDEVLAPRLAALGLAAP
jgi:hypothetical protein